MLLPTTRAVTRASLFYSSQCSIFKRAYSLTTKTKSLNGNKWLTKPPESILFVKKSGDKKVASALESVLQHLNKTYPALQLYHEASDNIPNGLKAWSPRDTPIDLVVTLGGDGTILHASSLFWTGPVPPVLSFSMGTLGFLLPFNIDSFPHAFDDVFKGKFTVLERMRVACTFHDRDGSQIKETCVQGGQVMNEMTLHRGRSPHLTIIDAFVDGEHLTEAVSDGLILSTPTGSTAYSLSSGGPIVHPSVQALLLTPICPRSLSFRTLVLPSSSKISLRINHHSRAPAQVSMDGQEICSLHVGESVSLQASPHPVPCINRSSPNSGSGEGQQLGANDWVRDINDLLNFNTSFKNKSMLVHGM